MPTTQELAAHRRRFADVPYGYEPGYPASHLWQPTTVESWFLQANPWAAIAMQDGTSEVFQPFYYGRPQYSQFAGAIGNVPGAAPPEDLQTWEDIVNWSAEQYAAGNYPAITADQLGIAQQETQARQGFFTGYYNQLLQEAQRQFGDIYPSYLEEGQRGRLAAEAEERETVGQQTQTGFAPVTPTGQTAMGQMYGRARYPSPYQQYRRRRERAGLGERGAGQGFYFATGRQPTLLGA